MSRLRFTQNKIVVMTTLVLIIVGTLAAVGVPHSSLSFAHASSKRASATGGDWPMFMGDIGHTGLNSNETTITATTAKNLALSWQFTTGGAIYSSPIISNGVLYIGSWDGYEYAISTSTHQQLWKQYLGQMNQPKPCYNGGGLMGVSSSPTVQNGVMFVGGGDGNFYALNTSDGSILWKTFLGAYPYYIWSSPLYFNNTVYVGLSGFCDPPYVQGKVEAFNPANGSMLASVSLVPDNQTGAPVTSSLVADPATNKIFVTTGNPGSKTYQYMPYSEAFVALDANSLQILDSWQVPASEQANDIDFIGSPTLFDLNGSHYIGAINKNGYYYVLNRDNLASGPVWEDYLNGTGQLVGSDNDSTACYNNGVLYLGTAPVQGTKYTGSVLAVNAATGKQIWFAGIVGRVHASITCTNDLIVDGAQGVVQVRAAATGKVLFQYTVGKKIQGTPVISNGTLYVPSQNNSVYAFTVA